MIKIDELITEINILKKNEEDNGIFRDEISIFELMEILDKLKHVSAPESSVH